jgi:hypothetical protein
MTRRAARGLLAGEMIRDYAELNQERRYTNGEKSSNSSIIASVFRFALRPRSCAVKTRVH